MKKFLMTMAAMFVTVVASAQVYLGGGIGLGVTTVDHEDGSVFSWKVVPEIGYQFNEKWDAGLSIGFQGVQDGANTFEVAPYARYSVYNAKLVDFFIEGTVAFKHISDDDNYGDVNSFAIGFRPGIKVKLSDHFDFVGKVGFLGYEHIEHVNSFGFDFDGTNVQLGLLYKF